MERSVFTIGHSNHPIDRFLLFLSKHHISAVCDVRSQPYSRTNPQFNRESFKQSLKASGIAYVFLGEELGARSKDPSCYAHGKVQYDRLAGTTLFKAGLERMQQGLQTYKIALMCAEKEPLDCHRTILIARQLILMGIGVSHILEDGRIESHDHVMKRLLRKLRLGEGDMFCTHDDLLDEAYRLQSERIAFQLTQASLEHIKER